MKPEVKLMWATPDPEFQIVRAARICYQSEGKIDSSWVVTGLQKADTGEMQIKYPVTEVQLGPNDKGLLDKLMTNNHNACLRFASAAFTISGISRVCSHQLVRIAHFGILQKSDRYSETFENVIPEELMGVDSELDALIDNAEQAAESVYIKALEKGVNKEFARYMLPNASQTEINMCANFQGWKHFLDIRLNKKVQPETLKVAGLVCEELVKVAPNVFESDYVKLQELGL